MVTGRLSVVSAFSENKRRPTVRLAEERNRIVAILADEVLIPYAAPGGKTEHLAREILEWKKIVRTFPTSENASLLRLGATPVTQVSVTEANHR